MSLADTLTAQPNEQAQKQHRFVGLLLVGMVVAMVGVSYAAVPLYKIFCQVTGYGGTTNTADVAPTTVLDRMITVRFDSNVNRSLAWDFAPAQVSQELKVGETGLAFFRATNLSDKVLVGTATFNVTPQAAGYYFNKIDCFCFTEQVLQPGETVDMPVTYFIDPEIADDKNLDYVHTITLSYTFFPKQAAATTVN
ncbi:MAG: cytochrome c oxidase assembly protein [Rhodobiaceae bacterium]|nr:MAG: cytochrome c oxidase assembly protein [Rhodobiaceae bacterium]